MPEPTETLPDAVVDHGDRIEVPARRAGVAWSAGGVLLACAVTVAAVGPGDLDTWLARTVAVAVLTVVAVAVVAAGNLRARLDGDGAVVAVPGRSRSLPWSQVRDVEVEVDEVRGPVAGWVRRLPGGITVSSGAGGGARRGSGVRVSRLRQVADLRLRTDAGRDLVVPLGESDRASARAVVEVVGDRGWWNAEAAGRR